MHVALAFKLFRSKKEEHGKGYSSTYMKTGARIWNAVNLQISNYVMFCVRLDMRETKLNEWSLGKDIGNIKPYVNHSCLVA